MSDVRKLGEQLHQAIEGLPMAHALRLSAALIDARAGRDGAQAVDALIAVLIDELPSLKRAYAKTLAERICERVPLRDVTPAAVRVASKREMVPDDDDTGHEEVPAWKGQNMRKVAK